MYKVNEYVIYRKDVCKIIGIKEKNNINYYILVPIDDNSLKIEIPIDNNILKSLISKEEANKLIQKIPNIKPIEYNDKTIENEYKQLLSTGSKEDLIKIIKTAYLKNKEQIDNKKKISDKNNNYFNKAEKILYNELSIILNMTYEETKNHIIIKASQMEK